MEEKILSEWSINSSERKFVYSLVFAVIFFIAVFSFFAIYIISQSNNIILLVVPIVLGVVFLGSIPDFLSTFKIFRLDYKATITQLGVNLYLKGEEAPHVLPFEHIKQYDVSNFNNTSPLGFLFPKPRRFILNSIYPEESFEVLAFGEDGDVLLAYLKEHNVAFGFVEKS